jgi:hypothetical protein
MKSLMSLLSEIQSLHEESYILQKQIQSISYLATVLSWELCDILNEKTNQGLYSKTKEVERKLIDIQTSLLTFCGETYLKYVGKTK